MSMYLHTCPNLAEAEGPFSSYYPMHADDPSLSYVYAQHVPPPGLASNYTTYICAREQIHISRAKLYVSTRNIGDDPHDSDYVAIEPSAKIMLQTGGRGLSEDDPLLLSLELPQGKDRKAASEPVPVWVEGGRAAAVAGTRSLSALGMCAAYIANCVLVCPTGCPKACCGGLRSCWIETWTCGNPQFYAARDECVIFLRCIRVQC